MTRLQLTASRSPLPLRASAPRRRQPERGRARFNEEAIIRRFIRSMALTGEHLALDVGCGYGSKLEWLREEGVKAQGVDINPDHVAAVRERGFDAMTVEEFNATDQMYDALLMAHIIEHFPPAELLGFIDGYLDRLAPGGFLLIATPLPWEHFLQDFDHVRPYLPQSLLQVFGQRDSQVQYHSRNQLNLLEYGIRRWPIGPSPYEELYSAFNQPSVLWRLRIGGLHQFYRVLFRLSGGTLGGRTCGWIGLFQKCSRLERS
jgi:SAM-dependent methyltransferase